MKNKTTAPTPLEVNEIWKGIYTGDEFPDYIGKEIEVADDHSNSKNPCYKIRFVGENDWINNMGDEDWRPGKQPANTVGEWTKGKIFFGKPYKDNTRNTIYPILWHSPNCPNDQYLIAHTFKNAVGKGEAKANAARIVECWNGYDGLKKENERLNKSIDGLLETGGSKLSNQQYQLLKAENEKVKNWWHEAQELAGQMTKVASEHEKEIEALKAANRELLEALKTCSFQLQTFAESNAWDMSDEKVYKKSYKAISKHSKQTT